VLNIARQLQSANARRTNGKFNTCPVSVRVECGGGDFDAKELGLFNANESVEFRRSTLQPAEGCRLLVVRPRASARERAKRGKPVVEPSRCL
jgi:hypothetical protein